MKDAIGYLRVSKREQGSCLLRGDPPSRLCSSPGPRRSACSSEAGPPSEDAASLRELQRSLDCLIARFTAQWVD